MKTSSIGMVCFALTLVGSQAQTANVNQSATKTPLPTLSEYRVVDRGAHEKVWQRETYETGPNGQVVTNVHRYTELATGLNYKDAQGQWQDAREEITILPDGTAAAIKGQHQAYFPANIYSGVIKLVTPDGQHLKSRPLGLSYDDGTNALMIAELTNSIGYVVGSNQVIYPNAFTGFKADLRYTYTKAGFEQDVILRQQPPTPESLGLNPDTAKLQVLTEFFSPPQPARQTRKLPEQAGLALDDESLGFGQMQMIQGRAFLLGQKAKDGGALVGKQWVQLDGRQFLVEEVPVDAIVDGLAELPLTAMNSGSGKAIRTASKHLTLPPQRLAKNDTAKIMLLAKNELPARGFVLDYVTLNISDSGYLFKGDTTYYISGDCNFSGYSYTGGLTQTIFEGGTVLKFATGVSLGIYQHLVCPTALYRPAILTAKDDDSVGEQISGSTGSPTGYYASTALSLSYDTFKVSDMHIRYAQTAINNNSGLVSLKDCQIINCSNAVNFSGSPTLSLDNNLFSKIQGNIFVVHTYGNIISGTQLTLDQIGALGVFDSHISAYLHFTNCMLVNVTNIETGKVLTDHCVTTNASFGVFQSVGGGSYYLTTNSPYRNAGTTNIDADLLADIQTKTTYPPMVYSNTTISVPTTLSPQAQRDTDIPDIGYHYDPLDYAFGGVNVSSNLIFSAGTAVGWFELSGSGGPGYGISLPNGATAAFNGTAVSPCFMVRYNSVQEGGNGFWLDKGWLAAIIAGGSYDNNAFPKLCAQFTCFDHLAGDPGHFRDYNNGIMVQAMHSEFYGAFGGYDIDVMFTNCLIYRANFWQGTADAAYAWETYRDMFVNCTWYGGSMEWDHWEGSPYWKVLIQNCAFDGTLLNLYYAGGNLSWLTADYNATNTSMTYGGYALSGTHNLAISGGYNWQTSWLGNFYLPTNSPLINAGNTNANLLSLYHFTTQTNQVKETNSIVDIGYHYVAMDANGFPLDIDSDGLPDYAEDANGNGVFDVGDLSDWADYFNSALPVLTIISGNNQNGTTNAFLPLPLTVSLTRTNGTPLTNAPLNFTVSIGGALLATSTNGTITNSITLRTGTNGQAAVYAYMPSTWQSLNRITATAQSGTNSVQVTFTASTLQGAKLWLRADTGVTNISGAISGWADQSGNTNNATQSIGGNQPIYFTNILNGLPVVRFNGTNSYFNLPIFMSSATAGEAFVVLKVSATNTLHALWEMDGFAYGQQGHEGMSQAYSDTDGSIRDSFGSTWIQSEGIPAQPLTQYHLYEVVSQNNNWMAWVNGALQYQTGNNAVGFPNYAMYLGSSPSRGCYFAGDIAEVLMFNRALTTGERTTVNTYLNGKYRLTATPSAPTNLTATAISSNQISLTWDDSWSQMSLQFAIERSTASNGTYQIVGQVLNANSYIDTNLVAGTTYYYKVQAINLTSWSTNSNAAQAMTLTNGASVPLGSLTLWLKADAGLVQGSTNMQVNPWPDSSGRGNSATQTVATNRPIWVPSVIGDRPVVRFNGTNTYFNLPNFMNAATQAETFVVLKVSVTNHFQSLWKIGSYSYGSFGGSAQEAYPDTDGSIRDDFGSSTRYSMGIPAQPLTQYHLLEMSSQLNYWAAWINGSLQYQTANNNVGFSYMPTLGQSLNSNGYDSIYANYFAGDIAEILVFNRVLTTDERDSMGNYLVSKFNLAQYATNAIPPTAPTNLLITGTAPYQLNFQWALSSTNVYSVHVERQLGTNGTFQEVSVIPPSITNYVDTNVVPTNTYFYRVRAHNLFGNAYSTSVSPPTVAITNWPSTIFESTTNQISAQASDIDGTVSNLQFFAYGQFIGLDSTSPYAINWVPLLDASYTLTALATDNQGNSQYSAPVYIKAYLDSNGDGIPDVSQISSGGDPLNPWVPPAPDTNDLTAPIITLLVPTNAVVVP